MKKFTMSLLIIFSFMFISCNNEEEFVETKTNSIIENKDGVLQELQKFTQYTIKGVTIFYDRTNDFVDLDQLDQYILNFNFSSKVTSRSASENHNTYTTINYESALKEILSPDACNLLLSYISSHEQINKESLEQLRNDFSKFSDSDKEFFELIYSATNVIYSEIMSSNEVNTRAVDKSLVCNLAMALGGSAAGWIWGAAFAGPVGTAVAIAWELAATASAYYTC